MTIQNKIIILRDRSGLTQEDVAKQLGISKSSYCRKEKGNSHFTIEELEKLLGIFNASYDDLYEISFPLIHEEKISPKLLDALEDTVNNNSLPLSEWNENKARYERIQKALNPVLKERDRAFDFPELNLEDIERGTTVKQVNLDVRAEKLIKRALDAQAELAHAIFGAER